MLLQGGVHTRFCSSEVHGAQHSSNWLLSSNIHTVHRQTSVLQLYGRQAGNCRVVQGLVGMNVCRSAVVTGQSRAQTHQQDLPPLGSPQPPQSGALLLPEPVRLSHHIQKLPAHLVHQTMTQDRGFGSIPVYISLPQKYKLCDTLASACMQYGSPGQASAAVQCLLLPQHG